MANEKRISSEDWERVFEKWRASGDSQRGFCRKEGISFSTFTYWRKKLDKHRSGSSLVLVHDSTEDALPKDSPIVISTGSMRMELSGDEREEVLVKVMRAMRAAACS
ncbi:MAG: IS66 family insertion sequence element accessory protein TnpA [Planctomycetota bacterium]|jgi:transposase-like protein